MKIFVVHKDHLVIYALILALICGLVSLNWDTAVAVFESASPKKDLPIYSVEKGEEKICSISFDAAWGNEDTHDLIQILEKYNVKTTFFVVGGWVDKFPESVKELNDAGHEIMNHSDTHPHMPKLDAAQMQQEIKACDDKIEAVTGKRPILFRPPYGDYNDAVVKNLRDMGHYTVQWDVDSLDWKNLSPDAIYDRVVKRVQPGSIVLFHNAAKNTPAALPRILETLTNDGYKIVPISELIYRENFTVDHAGKQIPSITQTEPQQ